MASFRSLTPTRKLQTLTRAFPNDARHVERLMDFIWDCRMAAIRGQPAKAARPMTAKRRA